MRAPMIPGRKTDDSEQREAMLRRLGIAEEKPRTQSRWDILARDLEPAAPVQTPPPVVDETPVEEPLPAHQPIPMTAEPVQSYEAPEPASSPPELVVVQAPTQPIAREPDPEPEPAPTVPELVVVQAPIQPIVREPEPAPEPVIEAPVARAPEPEPEPAPSMDSASFMPGWGEESIPEDEEVEAFDEPDAFVEAAAPVETIVHQPRWMDEPVAEAPRREELLPKIERPVGYGPAATIANDEDLDVPPLPVAEAPAAPVMEARIEPAPVIEPPLLRAPVIEPAEPVELPVARQPAPQPVPEPEPVVQTPVARDPFTPAPAPEPVAEPALTIREPEPEPVIEAPVVEPEPEPAPMARRQLEPRPAGPPVDAALQEMRAELEAMRKQFQTAPQPTPIVAAIPYEGRRKTKPDFFANARMVVWTLGIVWALWVTFHALQAAATHPAKQDQIIASVTAADSAEPAPEKTIKAKTTGRRSSRAHRTE